MCNTYTWLRRPPHTAISGGHGMRIYRIIPINHINRRDKHLTIHDWDGSFMRTRQLVLWTCGGCRKQRRHAVIHTHPDLSITVECASLCDVAFNQLRHSSLRTHQLRRDFLLNIHRSHRVNTADHKCPICRITTPPHTARCITKHHSVRKIKRFLVRANHTATTKAGRLLCSQRHTDRTFRKIPMPTPTRRRSGTHNSRTIIRPRR